MNPLELTFIGTGNAFVRGGACWNGFVANRRILFETPPQALMSLNRLGLDPNDLDAVILSHHHGDHFLGLPFMLLHWKHTGRTRPVTIVGPPETEAIARQVAARTSPSLFDSAVPIRWLEVRPGQSASVVGLTLEPVEVRHDRRLILSLGFAMELDGRRFAYTGDSAICEGVLDLARRAEVLVSECTSNDERLPTHMNLRDDMPAVRAAMSPDANLVLTHLPHDLAAPALDRTHVARDFETLRF
jgi:ribonuclease BN (tRNA processing enzyme)